MSPSRTGPFTLRMINRFWSSRNLTRTWVTCEWRGMERMERRKEGWMVEKNGAEPIERRERGAACGVRPGHDMPTYARQQHSWLARASPNPERPCPEQGKSDGGRARRKNNTPPAQRAAPSPLSSFFSYLPPGAGPADDLHDDGELDGGVL